MVNIYTTSLSFKHSTFCPCSCVFWGSENSDYFTVQHWLVGFCNWDRVCLQRGTFCILRSATKCIYVFCVDLRTNSDYFTVQHWLVGFCNWDGVCLQGGRFYILRSATKCIYVFCVDLIKNRDYFNVQHWLVGFYNWDGVCLLRGTDWVCMYNSVPFQPTGLLLIHSQFLTVVYFSHIRMNSTQHSI